MKFNDAQLKMIADLIIENTSIKGLPQVRVEKGQTPPEVHLTTDVAPVIEYIEGVINASMRAKQHNENFFSKLFDAKRFKKTLTVIRAVFSEIPKIYV